MGCNLNDPLYQPKYPLGKYQRFVFGATQVTLETASFVYAMSSRETELGLWGYDRYRDEERAPKMIYGYNGASHKQARVYWPLFFSWNLRGIPANLFEKMDALYELSLDSDQPVRLYDRRKAFKETAPRSRAQVGTVINPDAQSGMVYYFPQFNIRFDTWKPVYTGQDYSLSFTAQEYDPHRPVPLAQDVAA